ncbi:MAG TPA: hypothetical protein VGE31_01700 [Candidatus Paceibacterota bacterium]
MSDDLKKDLPKVRTFARDIEEARRKTGEPLPSDVTIPTLKEVVPQVVEKKATPQVATHIPAFHELQKKPIGIDTKTSTAPVKEPVTLKGPTISAVEPVPKKIQVRAKKRPQSEQKITGGGTIITDTKKGDFSFFPALLASIDRSVASFATLFKKKSRPTYSITATERRKGVIQKATSKTGTIFTADSETLKEEIRRRQQRATHKPDPQDGEREILWSPNTETGYNLLGSGAPVAPRNVTLEFKKRTLPEIPVTPAAVPTPPVTVAAPAPVIETTPEPPVVTVPPPTPPLPVFTEPTPLTTVIPNESVPVEVQPEAPVSPQTYLAEETYTEPEPVETPTLTWTSIRNLSDVTKVRTNTLALGILSIVFVFIVVIVGARAMLTLLTPAPETGEVVVTGATPLSALSTVVDIEVAEPTPNALIDAVRNYDGEIVATELRAVNARGEVMPAKDVLALMTLRVDPNFIQSVSQVHIAHLDTSRAVVLRVTDSTTALGSLLQWESTMTADLADVLGLTLISAGDGFVDQQYRNTDVRILRDGETQLLVYGFIDDTTVVIAPDIATFAELLGESAE